MDVFDLRNRLVDDYARYTRSFIKISDARINAQVENALVDGALWPEPLLQLNPTFQSGGTIKDLVKAGLLHKACEGIFRIDKSDANPIGKELLLHAHQKEAIRIANEKHQSYILTSGTGSGKSLTYIIPIVDHILKSSSGKGIQAIVVYPMNALANSQFEELGKFLEKGFNKGESPVRFARFTGQEKGDVREEIRNHPPDILLTNYVMLELLLTRHEDRALIKAAQGLKFLVLDELHTYRGRQGADVAMLMRRCRFTFDAHDIIFIGTSATMTSDGSVQEQKQAVASVAQTLFGTPLTPAQVIGEFLERSTPETGLTANTIAMLQQTILSQAEPPDDFESFRLHPLSSWIESYFGVRKESAESEFLVRQPPQKMRGEHSAAADLAKLTGTDEHACYLVLRRFLIKGSNLFKTESSRFPIFAFRLHQFFTRGDTLWSTLEPESIRFSETSKMVAKPDEPQKPLFPLVFCRTCGKAYYRVYYKAAKDKSRILPREDRLEEVDSDTSPAFIYASESFPWPHTEGKELLDRLPSYMKETLDDGTERIKREERDNVPEVIFVTPSGQVVSEGEGMPCALIEKNFLFCLEPGCGIAYTKDQRSERTKLATLGVDSRSTATTILAVRALLELQADKDLRPEARKLLSFTDNRQDASLQAGHFNDFVQVALLRSALFKAAEDKGTSGLSHAELSRNVFASLALTFDEYAADPNVRGPARTSTDDALRRVIDYFLYRDLKRGWRVTAPNLEDCGLLHFDYDGLTGADGLINETEVWQKGFSVRQERIADIFIETPPILKGIPANILEEILRTLLDVLRRGLAVKIDVLDPQKQRDLIEQTNPRMLEGTVWYLENINDLEKAAVAFPRSRQRGDYNTLHVSSFSSYGRYLRRTLMPLKPKDQNFGRPEVDAVIQFFFQALKRYGIVEQVRDQNGPGYQINHDSQRWIAGNGQVRPVDRTRMLDAGEIPPEVNSYFAECYKRFIDLKGVLEAREHTAQVASEDREEREERFRSADLPLLFCSPTMELGVDIAQLNMVNMRNVPPTPANYAQRSGRAGRGGQPALVYTYCAGRSPHDQYYFHRPERMVAGVVAPPRLDLRNRDLLRSHLNAIWLEMAQVDLGKTLTEVIDIQREDSKIQLPIKTTLQQVLTDAAKRARAFSRADSVLATIKDLLANVKWFHDNWVKESLDQIELNFDHACNRWRELYRAAVRQREIHHKIISDHTRPEWERDQSRRLRAQAESQIRLLTEAQGIYEGDFYTYRYFAAEGFLPGYNFPRLPLSAFVPGRRQRRGRDEFFSRPRFLAISEFGPRALIYHEGARYRVYKVNLDFGSDDIEATHNLVTSTMKRCSRCGYAHIEKGPNLAEMCDRCNAALDVQAVIPELVHLQNVSLKLAQRITCDEEERQQYGYRLATAYRFPEFGGRVDRQDAEIVIGDKIVMKLSYGDATALYRINMGWANQRDHQPPGFLLEVESGYWARNPQDQDDPEDSAKSRQVRVVPYVTDTKNALVMHFEPNPGTAIVAGLQAAFKEAIQQHFQLESRELAGETMPSPLDKREILFYEASEGGAGVLRQLVEDPQIIPKLARMALEICHFDPDTLQDKGISTCGKACYECLLDYTNQPDHLILDRNLIKNHLVELMKATGRPAGGTGSRSERLADLRKRCDSDLEIKWLDQLDKLGYRPPSHAQFLIDKCKTRPDFFYSEYNAAIYIDGPVHDAPDQQEKDEEISEYLLMAGYVVIRFHYKADWQEKFLAHPDIFGEPQT